MVSDLNAEYDIIDERLSKSEVLLQLGYASRAREDVEASASLPARSYFNVVTGRYRCLSIGSYYHEDRDLLLTFEISHTMMDESFLLEDWSRPFRDPDSPYPFLTSAYAGDFVEKLDQLISYVDSLLRNAEINGILKGDAWTKIASLS